ncbi:uncharacterized protein LOC131669057 [Phymastichus coffea]|uniref:uncharacterized protein LOC131669057 n=1 Tax=Phymastichus coffea TaxID=108790 RepID=UPI00273AB292|nr:uncharacterized protein LOC131669057 [Phymastichus coffea]
MARYALLFFCLVGLATAVDLDTKNPTIYVEQSKDLDIGKYENDNQDSITRCDLQLTNGTVINLYPKDTNYNAKYSIKSDDEKCISSIYEVTEEDSGTYAILTTIKGQNVDKSITTKYNVKVRAKYEKKTAVPSDRFFVYPNQLISVRFNENFLNLKSCMLIDPTNIEYELDRHLPYNVKKLDHCGFKMVANKEFTGKWTLIADLDNNTAYYIPITVIIRDIKELNPDPINLRFKRGDEACISLTFNKYQPKMCYLKDPHGFEYLIQIGSCHLELDFASDYHKGVWKAYYGFEGMETLVEQTINVDVYDELYFNSSVTRSRNGDINLLCQVNGQSFKYCSFVRPDGEILHITFGVGNKKYEYYGDGSYTYEDTLLSTKQRVDCGITIHSPNVQDYGSWRCLVKLDNYYGKTVGTVLKVGSETVAVQSKSKTKADDVYVKRGESYKIKCTAEEVLSYCWLRSPNGTIYSVLHSEKPKGLALKYVGTGLELGDCTALVSVANDTETGKWTCHMGITNGPEIETSLNVIVTDSNLIADRAVVVLNSHSETDLICRPLPQLNKAIEACRWVNPLGHGINVDREGRYYTETGTTHCKLSIRLTNSYQEDVGSWSCYVRFANTENEEEVVCMNVIYNSGLGIASILSIVAYVAALISIIIGVVILYKRRLAALRDLEEKIIVEKDCSKFP